MFVVIFLFYLLVGFVCGLPGKLLFDVATTGSLLIGYRVEKLQGLRSSTMGRGCCSCWCSFVAGGIHKAEEPERHDALFCWFCERDLPLLTVPDYFVESIFLSTCVTCVCIRKDHSFGG